MGNPFWRSAVCVFCAVVASLLPGARASAGWQYSPAISGDIVVWQDSRSMGVSGWDIWGYDLVRGEEFPVCTAPGNQEAPAIDGKLVVWQDERSVETTGSDIYLRDLESGPERVVCAEPGNQSRPVVGGGFVVWEDWRSFAVSGPDIWGCDLASGEVFRVCADPGSQRSPSLQSGIAAWEDWGAKSGETSSSKIGTSGLPVSAAEEPAGEGTSATSPPVVYDVGASTGAGQVLLISLGPSEADGRPLAYEIVMGPFHGEVVGKGHELIYTPAAGYAGVDTFWFRASGAGGDSNVALASIAVMPVNHTPVAESLEVPALSGRWREFSVRVEDADGDALTYRVVKPPKHGRLMGQGPTYTYVPSGGYVGSDEVVFRASDGVSESEEARVRIVVRGANATPEAVWQEVEVSGDTRRQIVLGGVDGDGDRLTYEVIAPPAHGRLEGPVETGCIAYIPADGYTGADRFAFAVSDGISQSRPGAVSIRVAGKDGG